MCICVGLYYSNSYLLISPIIIIIITKKSQGGSWNWIDKIM